jgi:hypothetical protein
MARFSGDRGQAIPALALVLLLLVVSLLVLARVGRAVGDRARARTAADAAALAGVHDGEAGARRLAERNGGHLVLFARAGRQVEVTVVVGAMQAVARAQLDDIGSDGDATELGS